jgi:hypothetical protein
MSPLLHNNSTAETKEPSVTPPATEPKRPRSSGMRSAMDLCAEALIQAMVNVRKF